MTNRFPLVLGTNNAKKREELVQLLDSEQIEVQSLGDFEGVQEVEETGTTFAENAALKAVGYAGQLGKWVLAEDSGLSVGALDGAPGVYSARYSGPEATDSSNNARLLEALRDVPPNNRTAWYTCHIALSDAGGQIRARSEQRCYGRILTSPQGEGGFGYDPLFEIPEYHRTFAELGPSVKAVLSHRGRAYRKLLPSLLNIIKTSCTPK